MKLQQATAQHTSKACQAIQQWLASRPADEVFSCADLARAAGVSLDHVRNRAHLWPGISRFTRIIRRKRYWGQPAALDALEKMLQ
jgi:hypothetical protein